MSKLVIRFDRNSQGNDYIVGDIHGCFTLLQSELDRIGFDPKSDRLFSVGDLVDRGPESSSSIDWLDKPWFFAVRGNHEQMAIDWANGEGDHWNYMQNGGAWNVFQTAHECRMYADAFDVLPIAIELETENGLLGIVHADCLISPWSDFIDALSGPHSDAAISGAMWSRNRIYSGLSGVDTGVVSGVKAIVVGHTPLDNPVVLGNVHHIDTGAFSETGRFTIINAETLEVANSTEEFYQ